MTFEMAIARGRRWMLAAEVLRACGRGLAAAGVVALGVVLWGCVAGGLDGARTAVAAAAVGTSVALALLLRVRASRAQAAARLDERFGLKAALTSAMHADQIQSPLAVLVREEAERAAQSVQARRAADFRLGPSAVVGVVALVAALALAAFGPQWDAFGWQQATQRKAEEQRAVATEVKRLETALASLLPTTTTLRMDTVSTQGLTLKAALEAELRAAAQAPTARDSMARLTNVAEKIQQAQTSNETRRQPSANKLSRESSGKSGQESRLEKALNGSNAEAAKAELQRIAEQARGAQSTSATRAQAASALRQAAARQNNDEQSAAMSAALEELAKAVESGSDKDLQEALAKAEQAFSDLAADRLAEAEERKAYEEMLKQLKLSQDALASACQGGTCSKCNSTSDSQCSSGSCSKSQMMLQQQMMGNGSNWGVGTSNLDAGVGPEAKAKGIEDRNSARESRWTEKWLSRYEPVKTDTTAYAVRVTGRLDAGPLGGGYDVPSQPRVEVPRTAVQPGTITPANTQKDALNRADIPRSHQEQVKQYFESLDSE